MKSHRRLSLLFGATSDNSHSIGFFERIRQRRDRRILASLTNHLLAGSKRDAARAIERIRARQNPPAMKSLARILQAHEHWSQAAEVYNDLMSADSGNAAEWLHKSTHCQIRSYEVGDASWPESTSPSLEKLAQIEAERQRVKRAVHALSLGLTDPALAALNELACAGHGVQVRIHALQELARWHLTYGPDTDEASYLTALLDSTGKSGSEVCTYLIELLQKTGRDDEALKIWSDRLAKGSDQAALLGANLMAPLPSDVVASASQRRLWWINRVLDRHRLEPLVYSRDATSNGFDAVATADIASRADGPRVSIAVPVFNAARTLPTVLDSLARQSWRDLEVLVVDDASSDDSFAIARAFAARDDRFQAFRHERNGGPSAARNTALKIASGEYFTCNDADDWSHPRKIERQVRALADSPEAIANISRCMTATADLVFTRRGTARSYLTLNYSSLLFRRAPVLEKIGYWDLARFGADAEYLERLRAAFGRYAVAEPDLGPLSLVRQSRESRTRDERHGTAARGHTLRREYRRRYRRWHEDSANVFVDHSPEKRPFAIPLQLVHGTADAPVPCDVIFASEFASEGDDPALVLAQEATKRAGKSAAVLHVPSMSQARWPSEETERFCADLNPGIVMADQKIAARLFVAVGPIQERQEALPHMEIDEAVTLVPDNAILDEAKAIRASAIMRDLLGREPTWIAQTRDTQARLAQFRDIRTADELWDAWWERWLAR